MSQFEQIQIKFTFESNKSLLRIIQNLYSPDAKKNKVIN